MKNILVLYSRFSAYVNAAFSCYADEYETDIHVVRYAPDKNSPFKLSSNKRLFLYDRENMNLNDLKELVQQKNIGTIVCSGWKDKEYMSLSLWAKKRGLLTVCAFDNQWMGTFKQRLLTFLSPFILKPRFHKVWVPGIFQFEYARRLGFARHNIMLRFYTADTKLFKPKEHIAVPKKFIYVGRLLEIKGVDVLTTALKVLAPQLQQNGWKFMIVGSGDAGTALKALAEQYSCIEYYPFLQPEELAARTAEGGVFVLPSNYDAWAVVVHEYALTGCPLLMSEAVGSRGAFLVEEYNGKMFATGSADDLIAKSVDFMKMDQATLNLMGQRSKELTGGYNVEIWAATLYGAIREFEAGVVHKSLKRTKYQ